MFFIGIGAQKAATSWLAKMLDAHPELYVSPQKESDFFSKEQLYTMGFEKIYCKHFQFNTKKLKAGEISPSYLTSEQATKRIAKHYPKIKLFVVLRDPLERARSHIEHLKSIHILPSDVSLGQAIRIRPDIIENGLYGKHIQRYLRYFPREQVHVIWYNDIVTQPLQTVQSLYKYLGVRESYVPKALSVRHNTSVARRSPFYSMVNTAYKKHRRSWWGGLLVKCARLVGLRGRGVDVLLGLTSVRVRKYTFNNEEIKTLKSVYAHDKEVLREVLSVSALMW